MNIFSAPIELKALSHFLTSLFPLVFSMIFKTFLGIALILHSSLQFQPALHQRSLPICPSRCPNRLTLSQLHSADSSHHPPIRLNKAFKATHSRREADKLIASGRVLINGSLPTGAGDKVTPFVDEVNSGRVGGRKFRSHVLGVTNTVP